MNNPLLNLIAQKAAANFLRLIEDGETKILDAMAAAAEEAQNQETDYKFVLPFKTTINFDKGVIDFDLSWNVKHMLGTTENIPDPNQPGLPLDEQADSSAGAASERREQIAHADFSVTIGPEASALLKEASVKLRGKKKA